MRSKLTREVFLIDIPSSAKKITVKATKAVIYIWETETHAKLKIFQARSIKPVAHYRFSDSAKRDQYVEKWVESDLKSHAAKLNRLKSRNQPHSIKKGDIFVSSWGYEQTNVDFYQCVNVINKMIEVRKIAQDHEEVGYMQGRCVPIVDEFVNEEIKRCKVKYGNTIKISDCQTAVLMVPKIVENVKVYESLHYSSYH